MNKKHNSINKDEMRQLISESFTYCTFNICKRCNIDIKDSIKLLDPKICRSITTDSYMNILKLVVEGKTTDEISKELGISQSIISTNFNRGCMLLSRMIDREYVKNLSKHRLLGVSTRILNIKNRYYTDYIAYKYETIGELIDHHPYVLLNDKKMSKQCIEEISEELEYFGISWKL